MTRLRALARLWWLGRWRPPAGIRRTFVISDDGAITIHLTCGRVHAAMFVPVRPAPDYPRLSLSLDRIAVRLAEEDRIATVMAAEWAEFKKGVRKAAKGGSTS